ncbi:SDR family oxidoreductase [Kitasatospora acidiphila]|uniref:SDR family oxidoreductase n=1 Tax=Kitasatospora acidiphila TaxID=2567942 RepID=A0A540WG61_9ACTN|nr:SDR family oxidoreductase [Kitasatospora acidiphila]TQF08013.1 SDR family oxidoreductase [Kitasatospora acidiphila]
MTGDATGLPVAWVVGAGGIGSALGARLAADHRVVLFDRVRPAEAAGAEAFHQVDAADRAAFGAAASGAVRDYGSPAVVALTLGHVSSATVHEAAPEQVDRIVRDNFTACVNVLHTVHRQTRGSSCACLVVTSNAALTARPNQPLYAAVKAAVAALVRSLAVGWAADGIRLVGLAPGTVMVERNAERVRSQYPAAPMAPGRPGGRLVTPAELADFAAALLPHVDQLTGQVIAFDGGSTLEARR